MSFVNPQRSFQTWGPRSGSKSESGQALVEFALTLPLLSAALFAVIYLCMALYSYNMITDTAQEAARFASVRGSTCLTSSGASCTASQADIVNYAMKFNWPNLAGGKISASAKFLDANQAPGSRVLVIVNYTLVNFVPFMSGGAITMSQSSQKVIIQ